MKNDPYKHTYKDLPDQLVKTHKNLKFENHCYLRIALDNVFQNKWDTLIKKPAYKHLTQDKLAKVLELLELYLGDIDVLLQHNKNSLNWRKKANVQPRQRQLF